uniref:hypothetical protein n=1 Tax=Saccharothrix espanaensis TaxID=103731 RepID=UPI003F490D9E
MLGDGEPTHHLDADDLADWDVDTLTRCPGYVVLAAAPDLAGRPAHVRGAFARVTAGTVLAMPFARYLAHDHGVHLDLTEALIWHERPDAKGTRVRATASACPAGPR